MDKPQRGMWRQVVTEEDWERAVRKRLEQFWMDQVTIYLKETQQREKDQVDRTIWGSQEQIIHHQSKTEQEGTDWDGLQPVLPPRSTQKVSRTERN